MGTEKRSWDTPGNPEDLERYQQYGEDLSPHINCGRIVFDLRSLAAVSVSDLAEACGVADRDILAIEAGLQHLRPALAERMAKYFGIKTSDLLANPAKH